MRLTYRGPHSGVTILATGQTVEVGGTVDVDDDLGRQLAAQGWEPATTATRTVDEIKAAVGDDPDRARTALAAELTASKPRRTLITHLEAIASETSEED